MISSLKKHHQWLILVSFLLTLAYFSVVCFSLFEPVQAGNNNCSTKPIKSFSFIRTYHLRDVTEGFGVLATKAGGYLLTGETVWSAAMAEPYPYIIKTDAQGNKLWSRDFSSRKSGFREMDSHHEPPVAAETADGNIFLASDISDFIDVKYQKVLEEHGDILITKLNSSGTQLWSIMLGDYSVDRPRKLWVLPDGGVMLWAQIKETGHGTDVADLSAVPDFSLLIRIDKNGKVQSSKKMDWNAVDMERLTDGSFIALANIALPKTDQPDNILGPEIATGDLPTIIKLDGAGIVKWAKSLEMIPSEISAPTSYTSSTFTIGVTKIRMPGGDFRNIQPTPDGGFIAFGFDNLLLTQGISGRLTIDYTELARRPFVAVKVDAAGSYQWTKKLTTDLISGGSSNDFHVARTADGHFVIMKDVVRDSDGLQAKTNDVASKRQAFLDKCAELKVNCPDQYEQHLIPALRPLAKAANNAQAALTKAAAVNIGLIKVDADFNPLWVKKLDAEKDLSSYSIIPTADKGVAVVGSLLTNKTHLVMGSPEPYTEATLIKVDVNGGINGCTSVSNRSKVTLTDQSQYLVMQTMKVASSRDAVLRINKKVKEKLAVAKTTVRNICASKSNNVTPNCSPLVTNTSASTTGQTAAFPAAKTWALINFENAKEGQIGSERNKQIHREILIILNQLFNDQVKMTDSLDGMWLTYYFPRLVTRADVETVQKYYQDLGYKIDESEGGRLYVSRVGLTLHLTFAIDNKMVGKLEVLF